MPMTERLPEKESLLVNMPGFLATYFPFLLIIAILSFIMYVLGILAMT